MSKKCLRCDSVLGEEVEYLCEPCLAIMTSRNSTTPYHSFRAMNPPTSSSQELINNMLYGTTIRRNDNGTYSVVQNQAFSVSPSGVDESPTPPPF